MTRTISLLPIIVHDAFDIIHKAVSSTICFPYSVIRKSTDMYNESERAKTRKQKKDSIPPKVHKRKRDLTPPPAVGTRRSPKVESARANGNKKTQFHPQWNSSLLTTLPAEVRRMIWEEVILSNTVAQGEIRIHWIHASGRSHNIPTLGISPDGQLSSSPSKPPYLGSILNLLCTCKFIYFETIVLLYSTPTFVFREVEAFLGFAAITLPRRLEQIRNLHLVFTMLEGWLIPLDSPLKYWPIQKLKARNQLLRPDPKLPGLTNLHAVVDVLVKMRNLRTLRVELGREIFSDEFSAVEPIMHCFKSLNTMRRQNGVVELKRENWIVVVDAWWSMGMRERESVWPFLLRRAGEVYVWTDM